MSDISEPEYTHTTVEYVEPRIFNSDGAQMEGPLVEVIGHEYSKQNELLCLTMHMEAEIRMVPIQQVSLTVNGD